MNRHSYGLKHPEKGYFFNEPNDRGHNDVALRNNLIQLANDNYKDEDEFIEDSQIAVQNAIMDDDIVRFGTWKNPNSMYIQAKRNNVNPALIKELVDKLNVNTDWPLAIGDEYDDPVFSGSVYEYLKQQRLINLLKGFNK